MLLYIRNCHFLSFLPFISLCCSLPFNSLHCEILQKTRMWEIGCHSLLLCTLNPYTDPCNWSPSQGLVCVHLTTCPSPGYLGKPMLPGVGACGSPCFLLGWVGNAKHTSFRIHQELLTDMLLWRKFMFLWQLLVVSTQQAVQYGFFLHWINFVRHIHTDTAMCSALVQRMESSLGG